MKITWPNNKKFAFTICDDTDFATKFNVQHIYDFLIDLNMRTTKLVWVFKGIGDPIIGGETCNDSDYLDWLLSLQEYGFEIALHNVAPSTSHRELVIQGINKFKCLFGSYPKLHCNHSGNLDNLYWGDYRLSGWRRQFYNLWTLRKNIGISQGHLSNSPLFWGDLSLANILYVRNFTFDEINTLKKCPFMPYHDSSKPFVNYWFAATNASSPKYFNHNITIQNIDRLCEEGGLCIAYVHFGAGFFKKNKINNYFKTMMEYIVSKDGWFASVSEVLDFLRKGQSRHDRNIPLFELQKLELRWLMDKFGKKMGI